MGLSLDRFEFASVFNLRTDPNARADITAITYCDWLIEHVFHLELQRIMSGNSWRHSGSIPSENAANFNRDQVLEPGTSVRRPSLQTRCLRLKFCPVFLGDRAADFLSITWLFITIAIASSTSPARSWGREGTLIIPANKRSFAGTARRNLVEIVTRRGRHTLGAGTHGDAIRRPQDFVPAYRTSSHSNT